MSSALRLGLGPSILGDDRLSLVQHDAGFEVSDFHGAFTPGALFQPTGRFRALGPIEVAHAGSIDVKRTLAVYDPLDLYPEETVAAFERAVPAGRHDVFLARVNEQIVASLVRLCDAPVACWTPALLQVHGGVCPRPPFFPMFQTRFAVSYADAEVALTGELTAAARSALDAIRSSPIAASDGFVAFDVGGAGQYASWFGEDEAGAVVALATEYGRLRQPVMATARVLVSQALSSRIVLEEHDTAVSAGLLGEACLVLLEFGPHATFEQVCIETADGTAQQPVRMTGGRHEGRFEFAQRPAGADVIRLDFSSVSQPLLHLDPASVARKLEQWRHRGLIAVAPDAIPTLAQSFCDSEAGEIREWLAGQDAVDEVFF